MKKLALKLIVAFAASSLIAQNATSKAERTINIKNSDRILLIGGSFTSGGARDFRDKGFVSTVSQLTDWNIEGYGQSGDCYLDGAMAVLKNVKRYHDKLGPQDYNITKAISVYAENDGIYYNLMPAKYWCDNIIRYIKTMKSLGIHPVLCTQFGNLSRDMIYSVMNEAANNEKCDFIDISSIGSLFNGKRYLPFWNNGHPGIRTNSLLWYELVKYINSLDRPRQGIKIFRNRISFDAKNLNDYLFDSIEERMKKWREISIGHRRSTDSTVRYYDALDKRKIRSLPETSEYLKLINKESVPFEKYALVQITFPAVSSHIDSASIKIKSDEKLSAYARKYIDTSLAIDEKRNVGFRLNDPDTKVCPGDTYSSSEKSQKGILFTVIKISNGTLICSASGKWGSKGLQDAVLTKISGKGPEKINYFGKFKVPGNQYLEKALKPKGVFKELPFKNNEVKLDRKFLKKHMDYDKLYLLIHNNGSPFKISDIQANWAGEEVKVRNKAIVPETPNPKTELLKATKFDDAEIGKWTVPAGVKPQVPIDGCMPKNISKIVELKEGESISQKIRINTDKPVRAKIKCWARYLPPIFNPAEKFSLHGSGGKNAITEDSYDFGSVKFSFERRLGAFNKVIEFNSLTPLHWVQIEKEIYITSPKKNTEYTFSIKAQSRPLQLAFVSIEY